MEVIGGLAQGTDVYEPFSDEFDYKKVKIPANPISITSIPKILDKTTGDVVYAIKPRTFSFGVGILNKAINNVPIILDIDDWERGLHIESKHNTDHYLIKSILDPNGYYSTKLLSPFITRADKITTVSQFLQQKYQADYIIPHARDTSWLNPKNTDQKKMKKKYGVINQRVAMFLGQPRTHKGVEIILQSVQRSKIPNIEVMMVNAENNKIKKLNREYENLTLIDPFSFSNLPQFLSMADVVIIPQEESPASVGQVPAKLIDAMAMKKPIISTNIGDIPEILNECGIVVEPENVSQVVGAIETILEDDELRNSMREAARKKCVNEYSMKNASDKLTEVISEVI
ncbi:MULTISPECIES: glycosyltransferase [Halomicrobium]|uniref:glycosyltransferase n=1 Tax=Halomicrobium TaxID=203135 RepID=UPI0013E0BD7D|nr:MULTISPECIES: glycosyltransferase [Halomicrobium]